MSDTKTLNSKGLIPRCLLCLGAVSLLTYVFFHIYYLLSSTNAAAALFYIQGYVSDATFFILPCVGSAITLVVYAYVGTRRAVGAAFILSLSIMLYAFPYYYIVLIEENFATSSLILTLTVSLLADGINTPIGLALAFGFASAEALLMALRILLLFGCAVLFCKFKAQRSKVCQTWAYAQESLEQKAAFDLSSASAGMIFTATAVQFVLRLVTNIIDTVTFFEAVGSSYSGGEILTVIADYLITIILLVLSQLIATVIKNRLLTARLGK